MIYLTVNLIYEQNVFKESQGKLLTKKSYRLTIIIYQQFHINFTEKWMKVFLLRTLFTKHGTLLKWVESVITFNL